MTADDAAVLNRILRTTRIAHLGTLRDVGGMHPCPAPLVSMTLFMAESDFTAFHVHVSRLAWHTQDMIKDARVSLSVAEDDDRRDDPFTLARVSVHGEAALLANSGAEFERLREAWLARFPQQAVNFTLADFNFWRIAPRDARFVAGFGRIHNLSAADLRAVAIG